jgi:alpha-galactosidase
LIAIDCSITKNEGMIKSPSANPVIRWNSKNLQISSGLLSRNWDFGDFGLQTTGVKIGNTSCALARPKEGLTAECVFEGLTFLPRRRNTPYVGLKLLGAGRRETRPATHEQKAEELVLNWGEGNQNLLLTRKLKLYPEANTVVFSAAVRSESAPRVRTDRGDFRNVIDLLPIKLDGWKITAVQLNGRTDVIDDLVSEESWIIRKGSAPRVVRGNLLFLEKPDGKSGFFLLHESPPETEKPVECLGEFEVSESGVAAMWWGVHPREVTNERPYESFDVALGCWKGTDSMRLLALRKYLQLRYPTSESLMGIVGNPWGDNRCYKMLSEKFILQEIDACADVGIDYYQIDDGWQVGRALGRLLRDNLASEKDFWKIEPKKFPKASFEKLAKRAREKGVKLALWFAPDMNRRFRTWKDEAAILLDMYKRYGITLFKIDGVWLRDHEQRENLENMFKECHRKSGGKIWFNMDVTGAHEQRLGFYLSLKYGSIFVENRYVTVDWGIPYAPWKTLKNLWDLSRYVPPEKLQFEFANTDHAVKQRIDFSRKEGNPIRGYRWDYLTAATIFGSPLCWCEPSGLSAEARREIRPVLGLHAALRSEIARSVVLPIGNRPSGKSWTGFQAISGREKGRGWLLVFREKAAKTTSSFQLHDVSKAREIQLNCLSHQENEEIRRLDAKGNVRMSIARKDDWRLYEYQLL